MDLDYLSGQRLIAAVIGALKRSRKEFPKAAEHFDVAIQAAEKGLEISYPPPELGPDGRPLFDCNGSIHQARLAERRRELVKYGPQRNQHILTTRKG